MAEYSNSDFVIEDDVLVKYKGWGGDIMIPPGVRKIGENVFRDCIGLLSVELPDSLICIEKGAFANCQHLQRVSMCYAYELKEIGDYAFYGCSRLNDFPHMENVAQIGSYAFYGCSRLNDFPHMENVEQIGSYAFYGCSSLEKFNLPDSLKEIGASAFEGCTALHDMGRWSWGECVEHVGKNAFLGCPNLMPLMIREYSNIIIGDEISSAIIRDYISSMLDSRPWSGLYNDAGLVAIVSPCKSPDVDDSTFFMNENLWGVYVEDGVEEIRNNAFRCCYNLRYVRLPETLRRIGGNAFKDCSSLLSLTIPEGVESIERRAFNMCSSLRSITIPDSLKEIETSSLFGGSPFDGCTSLDPEQTRTPVFADRVFRKCGFLKKGYCEYCAGKLNENRICTRCGHNYAPKSARVST